MGFVERGEKESLAEHLLKNAEVLGADADQVTRLRHAFRLSMGTQAEKGEAGVIATQVRDELRASFASLLEGLKDRGEKVAQFNDAGAKRVKGRDGVFSLVQSGKLTEVQAKAALTFRLSYEACGTTLGSCLGRAGEGRGSRLWGDDPFYVNDEGELAIIKGAMDLHRAGLLVRLNRMELAVSNAMVDGRELHALRMIAGEGQTVNQVAGSSGHARQQTTEALQRSLDAIAKALRITGN